MFGRIRPIRKRLAACLVAVGQRHGFRTQPELAKCIGVSTRTLRNWIKCSKPLDVERIAECEALRIDFFDAVAAGERKV